MNPDSNGSEIKFCYMQEDGEIIELPRVSDMINAELSKSVEEYPAKSMFVGDSLIMNIRPPKFNQHFFDIIKKEMGYPTNNYLKFHGKKMRRTK